MYKLLLKSTIIVCIQQISFLFAEQMCSDSITFIMSKGKTIPMCSEHSCEYIIISVN